MVRPAETTTLTLQVEPSGSVRGSVAHDDGTPGDRLQVRVEASAGRSAVVQTGGDGTFLAEGVPAGAVTIRVNDPARGGVALLTGLGVTARPRSRRARSGCSRRRSRSSPSRPPTAPRAPPCPSRSSSAFNAPLAHAGGFAVRAGGRTLGFGAALSPDARTLTLTPAGAWPDSTEVTVEAGPWVTDVYGRRLAAPQQVRFRTVDLSPPRVIAVTPQDARDPGRPRHERVGPVRRAARHRRPTSRRSFASTSGPGPVPGSVTATASDTLLFTPVAAACLEHDLHGDGERRPRPRSATSRRRRSRPLS